MFVSRGPRSNDIPSKQSFSHLNPARLDAGSNRSDEPAFPHRTISVSSGCFDDGFGVGCLATTVRPCQSVPGGLVKFGRLTDNRLLESYGIVLVPKELSKSDGRGFTSSTRA